MPTVPRVAYRNARITRECLKISSRGKRSRSVRTDDTDHRDHVPSEPGLRSLLGRFLCAAWQRCFFDRPLCER